MTHTLNGALAARSSEQRHKPTSGVVRPEIRKATLFGARLQMCFLLVGGIIAMLIHHFFYAYLHGRLASGAVFSSLRNTLYSTISDQSVVNAISNATATFGKICFAGVISIAFAQVFWWKMRETGYSLKRIDDVTRSRSNFADPTAWRACYYTTLLAVVAICSFLLEAVTIATPGSLTVAPTTVEQIYIMPKVDFSNVGILLPQPAQNIVEGGNVT